MYDNGTAHNGHKLQILSLWHHILCSFDTCQLGKHFPFSEGQGSIRFGFTFRHCKKTRKGVQPQE